jgi:hypothetical protein
MVQSKIPSTSNPLISTATGPTARPRFTVVEGPRDTEFDAEHRLLTSIARRRPGVDGPIERVVTVKARGRLGDGRWLWSGDELTWGAISIVDARALGWDLEHTSSIRATVRSEGGTHRILVRHHLSAVTVAAG